MKIRFFAFLLVFLSLKVQAAQVISLEALQGSTRNDATTLFNAVEVLSPDPGFYAEVTDNVITRRARRPMIASESTVLQLTTQGLCDTLRGCLVIENGTVRTYQVIPVSNGVRMVLEGDFMRLKGVVSASASLTRSFYSTPTIITLAKGIGRETTPPRSSRPKFNVCEKQIFEYLNSNYGLSANSYDIWWNFNPEPGQSEGQAWVKSPLCPRNGYLVFDLRASELLCNSAHYGRIPNYITRVWAQNCR